MYLNPQLYDLDDLVSICKDFDSKSYINEAVNCYKNGSYRACIVNTWIALVFDLTKKIHELYESGVQEARQYKDQFNKAMTELHNKANPIEIQKFEKGILDVAKTLQLIDIYQYEDLKRLYEDRNRCAHPSFNLEREPYLPSAEQSRLHLRNTIEYVLSKKPIQGQLAIEIFNRYIDSDSFPSEYNKIKKQFQIQGLDKIPKKTLITIINSIFFEKLKPRSGGVLPSNFDNLILSVKAFIEFRSSDIYEKVYDCINIILNKSNGDEKYTSYIIALNFSELINFSDEKNDLFKNEIENIIDKGFKIYYGELYILCSHNDAFINKILDQIELSDIDKIECLIAKLNFLNPKIIPAINKRIIDLYKKQKSYDYSNQVSRVLVQLLKYLSLENIQNIISIIEDRNSDQVRGSYGVCELILALYRENLLTQDMINNSEFIKHKLQVNNEVI